MLSESLGFRGSDIMFSSNVTPAEEYKKQQKLELVILMIIRILNFWKKMQAYLKYYAADIIRQIFSLRTNGQPGDMLIRSL